jgi:hypothetical protein
MKTLNIRAIARLLGAMAIAAAVAGLAGCAAPAQQQNMAPEAIATTKKLPYTVSVEARGGADTGAMDSSNVSNADLKAAIESGITKSSLFKQVVQGRGGDYELSVSVTQLNKPVFGASFTVVLETGWTLVKSSDRSIVMRKVVKSQHTATMSDAFVGMTRLRLAVEGAVRNNIADGLQSIAALPL